MKPLYWNIGKAGAAIIMAVFAATPATTFLTVGILGKIIFWILECICAYLASLGLIVLNVGAAKLDTIVDGGDFDGSWDTAEKLISGIRNTGRDLTPAEIKAIDQPVIDAFRKFANFGRTKDEDTSNPST